jgi:hypothetical protein
MGILGIHAFLYSSKFETLGKGSPVGGESRKTVAPSGVNPVGAVI